ncbi:hypothetical protein Emed_003477 [Eimeria media]
MGNSMSCFDRWGKRAPDGALFTVKKTGGSDPTKAPSAFNAPAGASTSRRRQTYSSNASKTAESEVSSYDEGDDFEESDEDEELTTKDVRQQKLLDYRRKLTKIVKLKTHLFNATVKADNPKGLTITVNNPGPINYSFTFKTKEERVTWQEQLESFQKFMSMR